MGHSAGAPEIIDAHVAAIVQRLIGMGSAAAATQAQRYFRTGPGEYGEGDKFLGVRVPALRGLAVELREESADVAWQLLTSEWHEARLFALILLVRIYERGDTNIQKKIYTAYLKHTRFINNWDLVDSSAAPIVGHWLADKDRAPLTKLAASASLWERRIAMIATYHFIKAGNGDETLRIATLLLHNSEDLIHKAVGWMLREVGQRVSREVEERFLKQHYQTMPRTMLRYAIEHFPEAQRKRYLAGTI